MGKGKKNIYRHAHIKGHIPGMKYCPDKCLCEKSSSGEFCLHHWCHSLKTAFIIKCPKIRVNRKQK